MPVRKSKAGGRESQGKPPTAGSLARLRGLYPSLNRAARQVADVLLEDPERVIRQSVSEVASEARVSDATVVRVARLLGYRGYQDLKISLARDLVQPLASIQEDVTPGDAPEAVIRKVFQANLACLQETLGVLDAAEMGRAAKAIHKAGRLLIIGVGTSAPNCHDAANKFMRLGLDAQAETDGHLQIMKCALLAKGDCVLAISHSGSTKDPIETLTLARSRGCETVCITNNSLSPITKVARIRLLTASRETMFRSEAMSSRLAQGSIIDALFTLVAMMEPDRALRAIKQVEDAIVVKQF